MRNHRTVSIGMLVACMLFMMALAPAVFAQQMVEQTAQPLIQRDAFDQFTATLDEDRRAILLTLFEEYAAELAATWTEFTDHRAAVRDDAAARNAIDHARWRTAEARLIQFDEDVRAVLAGDGEALEAWNRFFSAQKRARFLPLIFGGGGSFANVDLSTIMNELELSDDETRAVEPVMREYCDRLNAIVESFAAGYIDRQEQVFHVHRAASRNEPGALDKVIELHRINAESVDAVAELNIAMLTRVGAVLTDAGRRRWNIAVGERTQPTLYRASPTDRVVEFLRENEMMLSHEERGELEAITTTYETERQRLRQLVTSESLRYVKSQKYEPLIKEDPSRQRAMRASPVPPYLKQLFELEKRTSAQLRALIGEDRAKMLPLHIRWLLYWDEDVVPVD